MNKRVKTLVACVGGRSGGHLVPALSYTRTHHPDSHIHFFATNTPLDRHVLAGKGIYKLSFFSIGAVPGIKLWRYPLFCTQITMAFFYAFFSFLKRRPERVVSMGGYISLPIVGAAWVLRIPIDLFELNAIPGKAVKALAPLATSLYVVFDETKRFFPSEKTSKIAFPHRFAQHHILDSVTACQQLGIPIYKKKILILGGSQGSHFLNAMVTNFIEQFPQIASRVFFIHQTGHKDVARIQAVYEKASVSAEVFDYREGLHVAYCAADVIIARAGAGTLFEIAFFQKPVLIIPLENVADDHQRANAQALCARKPHLFRMLCQKDIEEDPELFFAFLKQIIGQ